MTIFKIKYYDVLKEQDGEKDIELTGPEMSEYDSWIAATHMALQWCKDRKVELCSVELICM